MLNKPLDIARVWRENGGLPTGVGYWLRQACNRYLAQQGDRIAAREGNMRKAGIVGIAMLALLVAPLSAARLLASEAEDVRIALSLAQLLAAARTVISINQELINNPEIGDKGLTGDFVLATAIENYKKSTQVDPTTIDPASREGRLLQAEMEAIKEVTDENQSFINQKGVGFKAFIPAVFGRLVTERLREKIGDEAEIKVTAPPELVRNRKATPDEWETRIIQDKLLSPDWPRGQIFSAEQPSRGRPAFRVMVPEYYSNSCLACHGPEKGEIDITGYPKEGGKEGELGGVISITLFR